MNEYSKNNFKLFKKTKISSEPDGKNKLKTNSDLKNDLYQNVNPFIKHPLKINNILSTKFFRPGFSESAHSTIDKEKTSTNAKKAGHKKMNNANQFVDSKAYFIPSFHIKSSLSKEKKNFTEPYTNNLNCLTPKQISHSSIKEALKKAFSAPHSPRENEKDFKNSKSDSRKQTSELLKGSSKCSYIQPKINLHLNINYNPKNISIKQIYTDNIPKNTILNKKISVIKTVPTKRKIIGKVHSGDLSLQKSEIFKIQASDKLISREKNSCLSSPINSINSSSREPETKKETINHQGSKFLKTKFLSHNPSPKSSSSNLQSPERISSEYSLKPKELIRSNASSKLSDHDEKYIEKFNPALHQEDKVQKNENIQKLHKEKIEESLPQKYKKFEENRNKLVDYIKTYIKTNKRNPPTTLDFYMIGKVLGKGAFGKVNLCVHKLSGKLVAIKSLKKVALKSEESKKKYLNEISILKELKHPHIIRLYETFETETRIILVIELCIGGDLLSYLKKRRKIKESVAKLAFRDLLTGLNYMKNKKVAHRDIKLDNILLNAEGQIKICDFGVSKWVVKGEKMYERCGTPAYIAPEILLKKGYDGTKADIWSAGVLLYSLLYGSVPFKAGELKELQELVLTSTVTFGEEISEEGRDLLDKVFVRNPEERCDAKTLLNHSWFSNVDNKICLLSLQERQKIKADFQIEEFERISNHNENRIDTDSQTLFTEYNIETTENDEKLNISKSFILAPFNSTNSEPEEFENNLEVNLFKKKAIKFSSKLREFDRNYEQNNNGEVDNGVYIECEYSNYSMNLPEHRKESIHEETRNSKVKCNENKRNVSILDPMKKIELSDLGIH